MKPIPYLCMMAILAGAAVSSQAEEPATAAGTPVAVTASSQPAEPAAAKSSAAKKQTPAEELTAAQKTIGDMAADFTLTIKAAGQGGQDVNAQGKVWLASGRRYRVQYFQPERQLLVSDGVKRWLYLEKINQVQIQGLPASGDANEFFLELGGGLPALVNRCRVKRLPGGGKAGRGFELVPKLDAGLNFDRACIWLSPEDLLPQRVVVEAGHRVEARFKNVKVHTQQDLLRDPAAGVPAGQFTFAPPKDAEVIEMLWPGTGAPAQ